MPTYGKVKVDTITYDLSGTATDVSVSNIATKASPTFTGTVTVPTPTAGDNSTKAASTAFVVASFAPKADPAFTGTVTGVNLTLSGNLTVNGTQTIINTQTLDVEDKQIEIGKVSSPSDTTADQGGIILKGASDKSILWVNATDYWTFNQGIETTAGEISIKGAEGNGAILKLTADEGDDNADYWRLLAGSGGDFTLDSKSTGSWVSGITVSGSGNGTFAGTVSDSKGDLRKIIQNTHGSAYTLVAADAGKHILASGNITIPNSIFSAGDGVVIVNNTSGDLTITSGITNLYLGTDGSTGNKTLASRCTCTVLFTSGTAGYISGGGLS